MDRFGLPDRRRISPTRAVVPGLCCPRANGPLLYCHCASGPTAGAGIGLAALIGVGRGALQNQLTQEAIGASGSAASRSPSFTVLGNQ